MTARRRKPRTTNAELFAIGGPFHGKPIPTHATIDRPERLWLAGQLYLKHTAKHPANKHFRRDFYFHAASMTHSSPQLLEAITTWITGIRPTDLGKSDPKFKHKTKKRRSGMAPTPRDTADHAGEDCPRQNHGRGPSGRHTPEPLAETPRKGAGHHAGQPTVQGQTSPAGAGPEGHFG